MIKSVKEAATIYVQELVEYYDRLGVSNIEGAQEQINAALAALDKKARETGDPEEALRVSLHGERIEGMKKVLGLSDDVNDQFLATAIQTIASKH